MVMAMLASGLVAAGAPDAAAPADAFTPVEVLRIDFEDGGVAFGGDGGTFSNVVDPLAVGGENRVLQLDVSADWHGLQIPGRYLSAGATYRVEARVLDGTTGGTARFVSQTDDNDWAWIGDTPISTDAWTTVVGEFQARSSGVDHVRLVAHDAGSFFVDDVVVTRVAVEVVAPPAGDDDVVFERLEWDFEDGTSQGWFGRSADDGFGVVTPGADASYAIGMWDRTDQGSGPMVEIDQMVRPGQRLAFSADVRFSESVSDAHLTLSIQTGPSSFTNLISNMAVDADGEWTRIEGDFVVPAFTTMARLYLESPWVAGARGETAAFQVDNVVIDVAAPLAWDRDLVPFRETLPGIAAGVAVDSRDLIDEMGEVIAHHFSHLVGENHMKPEAWWTADADAGTAWSAGIETFRIHEQARAILDFAQEHDMTVHGHVLVWHGQTPAWFFSYEDSAQEMAPTAENQQEMVRRIWEYVGIVAGGIAAEYGPFGSDTNPVHSFEVANEVVHGGGVAAAATHNLRPDSPWTRIFAPVADSPWVAERGFDNRDWFLYEAFQAAEHYFNFVHHVGDARGRLNGREDRVTMWINDYNTERGLIEPANPVTKRYQLLQVVNRLLEAGAPLDGVGHQFHAGLRFPYEGLRLALDLFAFENGHVADRVLQAVTEIDVTIPSNTEANLVAQGRYYREAFDIIRTHHLEHGDIAAVTLWGLNDGRSWRASEYPLLFDDDLNAKPAFDGAVENAHLLDADIWDRWERPAPAQP